MQSLDLKKKLHEYTRRPVWRLELVGAGGQKKRVIGWWIWLKYFICMYENRIMKPIKIIKIKEWPKNSNEGWIWLNSLYACMEISQWNPFVQLIGANKDNGRINLEKKCCAYTCPLFFSLKHVLFCASFLLKTYSIPFLFMMLQRPLWIKNSLLEYLKTSNILNTT
jgi:hypothetical protein